MGIGEPSAIHSGGRFFQLADVLGVDQELGFSLSTDKYFTHEQEKHFLKEDRKGKFDFGEGIKNIYALSENTEIVEYSKGEIHVSAHSYGKGRGIYLAGLPYSYENTRLLMRSLYYSAGQEAQMKRWFTENPLCEVHAYPMTGKYAVVNNSQEVQNTLFYDGEGKASQICLEGCQIIWKMI